MVRQSINIRYVGEKVEETAFSTVTGIVWRPGDVHPVPTGLASKMLQHPDVFTDDDNPQETPQAKAAREAAARASMPQAPGGFNLMSLLPPGSMVKLPDGTEITIPGGPTAANPGLVGGGEPGAEVIKTAGSVGAEAALGDPNAISPTSENFAKPAAQRFASFSDPGDGFGNGDEKVTETKTGDTVAAGTLAPGGQVAAAPAPAPAPAPVPDAPAAKPVKGAGNTSKAK